MRQALFALVVALVASVGSADGGAAYARVAGGTFRSTLPVSIGRYDALLAPYELQRRPVTNADFLQFVAANPQWQRGHVKGIFADTGYLSHWAAADRLDDAGAQQPVTRVSWFAAQAYCEAQSARLPTWYEWEMAAAADQTHTDARSDVAWRQKILDWYARPAGEALPVVGQQRPNAYGVEDLHGVVWEWVEDAGSLMVSSDNRSSGDPDLSKFCGTGALTLEQKENYAVLMRIAMLSSLRAADTTRSLGFRCARDVVAETK